MSIFDDHNNDIINKAFTKEHLIQSIVDGYNNSQQVQLNYKECLPDDNLSGYALLSWSLDEPSYLANKENTAGYQLSHVTAMFDCTVDSTSDVTTIKVTAFKELEIEYDDSVSGVDGEFYMRNNEHLAIEVNDFDEVFKKSADEGNEYVISSNSLNPLREQLKTISISTI